MSAADWFALAAVLHAGFQVAVTVVVYPALVEVDDAGWTRAHERHSRRIVRLVVPVYGALVVSGAALVATGTGEWSARVALVATAGALVVTAVAAAPTHTRLGADHSPALLRRLLRADRLRCLLAVAGAVFAVAAVAV